MSFPPIPIPIRAIRLIGIGPIGIGGIPRRPHARPLRDPMVGPCIIFAVLTVRYGEDCSSRVVLV